MASNPFQPRMHSRKISRIMILDPTVCSLTALALVVGIVAAGAPRQACDFRRLHPSREHLLWSAHAFWPYFTKGE